MRKLTKTCILAATFFTMAFGPLAQVSAAPFQNAPQNYSYGQGSSYGDVEQVRHKGRHHYKKHRQHRSKRNCRYSHRRGHMVCQPRHRGYW